MAEKNIPTPQNNQIFSDYLINYASGNKSPSFSPLTPLQGTIPTSPATQAKMGLWDRFTDLLMRSTRTISNPVDKVLDAVVAFDEAGKLDAQGKSGEAFKKRASAIGETIVSPLTGFFSDDPKNKTSWADIIEKRKDVANLNNPDYVDVENNVNPIEKASTGFAAEVILDPLWLIPGGAVVKGAKLASRGIGTAVDTIKGVPTADKAVKGIKTVEETARLVGVSRKEAAKTASILGNVRQNAKAKATLGTARSASDDVAQTLKNEEAAADATRSTLDNMVPTADKVPAAQLDTAIGEAVAKAEASGKPIDDAVLETINKKIDSKAIAQDSKLLESNNLRREMSSLFTSWMRGAKADFNAMKAISEDVSALARPNLDLPAWVDNVAAGIDSGSLANKKLAKPIKVANGKILTNLREVIDTYKFYRKSGTHPDFVKTLEMYLQEPYRGYQAAVKASREANLLGEVRKTPVVNSLGNTTLADVLAGRIKTLSAESRGRAIAVLGEGIFGTLERMRNPEKLAKIIDDINGILLETGAVQNLDALNASDTRAKILNLFDITKDEIRAARQAGNVARRVDEIPSRAAKSTKEKLQTAAQDPRLLDEIASQEAAIGIVPEHQTLIEKVREKVLGAFQEFMIENFDQKTIDFIYSSGVTSTMKARRTADEFGLGKGLIEHVYNTHKQWSLFKKINKIVTTELKLAGEVGGIKFAREKANATLAYMRAFEKIIDDYGIPMAMDLDGMTYMLRFTEVYDTLAARMKQLPNGEDWLMAIFFNADTPAAITKVMDAVTAALRGDSMQNVIRILQSTERRNIAKVRNSKDAKSVTGPIDNWLTPGNWGKINHKISYTKGAQLGEGLRYVKNQNFKNADYVFVEASSDTAVRYLSDAILKTRDTLADLARVNQENFLLRTKAEVDQIVDFGSSQILDLYKTPGVMGKLVEMIINSDKIAADAGNAIDATFPARAIAKSIIDGLIPEGIKESAKVIKKTAKAMKEGKGLPEAKQAAQAVSEADAKALRENTANAIDEIVDSGTIPRDIPPEAFDEVLQGELLYDIGTVFAKVAKEGYSEFSFGLLRMLEGASKFFNRTFGMGVKENLWASRMFNSVPKIVAKWTSSKLRAVEAITKNTAYTPEVLQKAFNNLKHGVKNEKNKVVRQAMDDIEGVIGDIIGVGAKSETALMDTVFLRTAAGIEHIDKILTSYLGRNADNIVSTKGNSLFDLDLAKAQVKAGNYDTLQEAAFAQWKNWDIKEPVLFMGNLAIAASRVASDVTFVDGFITKALKLGLASTTPVKGFMRVTSSGKTVYGDLMGMRQVYFAPEALEILHRIDEVARSSTKFEGLFGKIVHEYVDVMADAWKYNITMPRPGHHFRNLWGDLTMTIIADGTEGFISAGKKALETLSTRNDYEGVDLLLRKFGVDKKGQTMEAGDVAKMLKGIGQDTIAAAPNPNAIVINKNKGVRWSRSLDHNQLYETAMRSGIFTDPATNEGLFTEAVTNSRFAKAIEWLSRGASLGLGTRGGNWEKTVFGVSQYRDHFARLQHFVQLIEKMQAGKPITRNVFDEVYPQSFDEMIELAAERVNKFHPDNSGLAPGEAKFIRRIAMFYGWTRGATQAFAEATVTAPARISAFNKASYAIAEAMGVNPNSIMDPFPDDQLFPSFFTEEVQGPQFEYNGRYYGFSPGIAPWDIQNMFTGSPTEISMSSLNPVMRLPLEFITGTNLGTGSRIRDYSDQVDSSIPGVNYLSNISSYSVTGSLWSMLQGKGLDKQLQYELGNKGPTDQLTSLFNWITGAGLRDYSRPSYIRFAQQELRDENNPDERGF